MKKFLSLILVLFAGTVVGQSVPGGSVAPGQVLTSAKWNSSMAAKADVAGGTLTTPTITNPSITGLNLSVTGLTGNLPCANDATYTGLYSGAPPVTNSGCTQTLRDTLSLADYVNVNASGYVRARWSTSLNYSVGNVTTNGTTTVSCAGGSPSSCWTAADVGNPIVILVENTSNVYQGTITSFGSASSITVSPAVSFSTTRGFSYTGTDDTAAMNTAMSAAISQNRCLYIPARTVSNTGFFYATGSGSTGWLSPCIVGDNNNKSLIFLGINSRLIDDNSYWLSGTMARVGYYGGLGIVRNRYTSTDVTLAPFVWQDNSFRDYQYAAIGINSPDMPYKIIANNSFQGLNTITSIGYADVGAGPSNIDHNAFVNDRIHIKLSGPAGYKITNNDFIEFYTDSTNVRSAIMIVPGSNQQSSLGLTISHNKFGNESLATQDVRMLFADSASYSCTTSQSSSCFGEVLYNTTADTSLNIGPILFTENLINGGCAGGSGTCYSPIVYSYVQHIRQSQFGGELTGTQPYYCLQFDSSITPGNNYVDHSNICGPFLVEGFATQFTTVSNIPGYAISTDITGDMKYTDGTVNQPFMGGAGPESFNNLLAIPIAAIGTIGTPSSDSVTTLNDATFGNQAVTVTMTNGNGGDQFGTGLKGTPVYGKNSWIDVYLRQGSSGTPATAVEVAITDGFSTPRLITKTVNLTSAWTRYKIPFVLTTAPAHTPPRFGVFSVNGAAGNLTVDIARPKIYQADEPLGGGQFLEALNAPNITKVAAMPIMACDGQVITNAVNTTASSSTVTFSSAANYTFSAIDVGKYITIPGAGASGGPLNTTITGVTSGTQITLSTAATTAVTSITNVTTTASSTSVTSTSGIWAAGDVGKTIIIPGAGANGTTLTTTIATYVSATSITVTAAPSTSIAGTGVASYASSTFTQLGNTTFGHADDVALQNIVNNTSAAGGGTIELPSAVCVLTTGVQWATNVGLVGQGAGKSILKWISTSDQTTGMIYDVNGSSTCSYGQASMMMNPYFAYFEMDDIAGTDATYNGAAKGISIYCAVNGIYDHLYIHDTPATSLANDENMPATETNNLLVNCGRLANGTTSVGGACIGNGSHGNPFEGWVITGNTIINPNHYGIFIETQNTTSLLTNATITGNIIYEGAQSEGNISQLSCAIGNSGMLGVAITGNSVYGNSSAQTWGGVCVDGGTLQNAAGAETLIEGNFIYGVYTGILVNYGPVVPKTYKSRTLINGNSIQNVYNIGIELINNTSTPGDMDGIQISNNLISSGGSTGILLTAASTGATASNIQIYGNTIMNNATTASTNYRQSGIGFMNNVSGLDVKNNYIYDDNASTQKYAIGIETGVTLSNADIEGNNGTGSPTAFFENLGTITGIVRNNAGLNPIGPATITPTTGVAYACGNTPTTIYLSGGTVTGISKNGTSLPTTLNQVPCEPGQSVTFTFSGGTTFISDTQ